MGKPTEPRIRPVEVSDSKAIAIILKQSGCFPHMDDEARNATEVYIAKSLELRRADDRHTIMVAEDQEW